MAKRIKLQELNEFPAELEQSSEQFDLMALNDNCIVAVLRQMSLNDLCSAAHTCDRLRELAREAFVMDRANQRYHIQTDSKQSPNPIYAEHLATFGDLLEEVELVYSPKRHLVDNRMLFGHIIQYCGDTLKQLTVHRLTWTPELSAQADKLLSRLTKYHSHDCRKTTLILPALKNCVDLNIGRELCPRVFRCDFLQLERFSYMKGPDMISVEYLHTSRETASTAKEREFLRRQVQLRRLEIQVFDVFDLTIIGGMRQLEELIIHGVSFSMNLDASLDFQFDRLEKLELFGGGNAVTALLLRLATSPAMHTLKHLSIVGAALSIAAVAALNRFTQLEHIDIEYHGNVDPQEIHRFGDMQQLKRLTLTGPGTQQYELPAPQSLEVVHLRDRRIDGNVIDQLGRMPQLRQLELCAGHFDSGAAFTSDQIPSFGNIDRLQKLEIQAFSINTVKLKFLLTNLGSTLTLQSFKLERCRMDDVIVRGLCRYRNLRELELIDCVSHSIDASSYHLHQLQNIKSMRLDVDDDILKTLLRSTGSIYSLQVLHIKHVTINDDMIGRICRHTNLRELRFETIRGRWADKLRQLGSLKYLEKMTVSLENRTKSFRWRDMVQLIGQLESLTCLQLEEFKINEFINMYDELLRTTGIQQRRLVIEFRNRNGFDLPSFMLDRENCRYLEIKQVLRK